MKKKCHWASFLFVASIASTQVHGYSLSSVAPAGAVSLFSEEGESKVDETKAGEGPSEAVIRKVAAMMPEQKFKRGEKQISKGGTTPEGTTVYPVQILNADGTVAFDATFFQEASGKWALFDNYGNIAREQ